MTLQISVCMIVRNEEEILERAVRSTQGLADEVLVLDTGSTDGTLALVERLGCRVLTGGDRMHKGQARNRCMEAARGDWIVILDADEEIADPAGLWAFLQGTQAQALWIELAYMEGDQATLSYQQLRCWRHGTCQYHYRCHETPVPVSGWGKTKQVYTRFVWEHRPPAGRWQWKSDYALERLLLDVEENPGDPRPLFYLGRQYMYRREWQQALEALERYFRCGGVSVDTADAWHCKAKCHAGLGQKQEQIRALYQAAAAAPERREWWCELAGIYHEEGKDRVALGLLRCALEQPVPERGYALRYWYGSAIYDLTARCLWKLGRYGEGLAYAKEAVRLDPDDERLRTNLLWFESAMGDMDAFYRLYGPEVHADQRRHQVIAELVEGPRVLDVGCGTGDLLLCLQDRNGFELYGTDISEVALEMAKERGLKAELIRSERIPTGQYETIVLSQVLEHLEDDEGMVKAAGERLADGGLLIASVPRDGRVPSSDHRREYSEGSLRELLRSVGEPAVHEWADGDRILMSVRKDR